MAILPRFTVRTLLTALIAFSAGLAIYRVYAPDRIWWGVVPGVAMALAIVFWKSKRATAVVVTAVGALFGAVFGLVCLDPWLTVRGAPRDYYAETHAANILKSALVGGLAASALGHFWRWRRNGYQLGR